jgi:hypothetical protein
MAWSLAAKRLRQRIYLSRAPIELAFLAGLPMGRSGEQAEWLAESADSVAEPVAGWAEWVAVTPGPGGSV